MLQRQKAKLECYQINLQHSWTSTDNLMQIKNTKNIDTALIQEPYLSQNRITGTTRGYRALTKEKRNIELQLSYQMTQ